MALNQSLKPKNAALAVHSSIGHHGVFAVKNVPLFHLDHVSINVVLFQKKKSKICGRTDYYGLWTSWSQCNDDNGDLVLCGDGLRRRTRTGFCENHDEIQDVECNTQRCCYYSPWTAWSDCSTTCGFDIQEQTINDCDVQVDRKVCTNIVVVPEWSEWGACSAECGNGLMVRERNDPCNRREGQMTKCRVRDCPYYGMWSAWSQCAVSCGTGLIKIWNMLQWCRWYRLHRR